MKGGGKKWKKWRMVDKEVKLVKVRGGAENSGSGGLWWKELGIMEVENGGGR